MAASMIWKGIHRAQVLCITQNDCGVLLRLQKPMCRFKATAAATSRTTLPDFLKPDGNQRKRKTPIHSIYIMEDYPQMKFNFEDCVSMHKEAAQPAMTNTLHTPIYADIKLNFSTNKKTKFMKNVCGLLEFPHSFDHQQKKSIFVFCESQTDQELCRSLGATQVGGEDLIGLFNQGILRKDDVVKSDFMFATPAMAVKLIKIRALLMERFPTMKSGFITSDLEEIMKKYMAGVTYKSRKISDAVGQAQVPFGLLNQDTDVLKENFSFMVSKLLELKPKNQVHLVQSVQLIAPPSTEIFNLEIDNFLPQDDKTQTGNEDDSDDED